MSETVLLGDEIELAYGKGLPKRARIKGQFPVFGSNGQVDTHKEALVEGPGIIVGRKGSVGEVIWSDNDFWPIDTTYYVKLKKPEDNLRYWFYQLKMLGLEKLNTHSAIPGLNRDRAYSKTVIKRSSGGQERIANILGVIDEKIELNRRMNETLEQIGQALFKEYFIDNPEAVSWKTDPISNKYSILLGGTPSRKMSEYWANGTIGWINSGKVNEFRITQPSELITEKALNKSAAKLLPKGSTVVAITGATLGQVSRVERSFAANQSVVGIVQEHDQFYNEFIYFWIKLNIDKLIGHQTGGAQQHINKGNIEDFPIIIPPDKLLKEFKTEITPLMELIGNNCLEAESLANLRDILLPRLISGKIKL